jgi:hypothetical protein
MCNQKYQEHVVYELLQSELETYYFFLKLLLLLTFLFIFDYLSYLKKLSYILL